MTRLPVLPSPVAVDAVTSLEDRFRCEVFSVTLSARACLKRQGARLEIARRADGTTAARATHERCARCDVGEAVAQRVRTAVVPEAPRSGPAPWLYRRGPVAEAAAPKSPAASVSIADVEAAILDALRAGWTAPGRVLARAIEISSHTTAYRALARLIEDGQVVRPRVGNLSLAKGAPR